MLRKRIKQHVLILGSPRSGSTWLAEIIDYTGEYKYIFEPFNMKKCKEWSRQTWAPVIGSEEAMRGSKRIQDLKKIMNGKISKRNKWVMGRGGKVKNINKIMVKAVRAHYMLPAITTLFPDIKIIYITRNPVDTIKSQIKSQFPYPKKIGTKGEKHLAAGKDEVDEYLRNNDHEEPSFRVLRWAMETSVALKFLASYKNAMMVSYEELKDDTNNQISTICEFLSIDPRKVPELVEKSVRKSSTAKISSKSKIDENMIRRIEQTSKSAVEIFKL